MSIGDAGVSMTARERVLWLVGAGISGVVLLVLIIGVQAVALAFDLYTVTPGTSFLTLFAWVLAVILASRSIARRIARRGRGRQRVTA